MTSRFRDGLSRMGAVGLLAAGLSTGLSAGVGVGPALAAPAAPAPGAGFFAEPAVLDPADDPAVTGPATGADPVADPAVLEPAVPDPATGADPAVDPAGTAVEPATGDQASVEVAAPGTDPTQDEAGQDAEQAEQASQAAAADLAVTVAGTALAAGASGKDADVTITNNGPATATGVHVFFGLSELDTDKVTFELIDPDPDACDPEAAGIDCRVIDVAPGQALDIGVRLRRVPGSDAGPAGRLTVRVRHAGVDPDASGDEVSVPVSVDGHGPDLFAYAPDVPFDATTNTTGTVAPGGTTTLRYAVGNFGDEPVDGVRISIKLPRHVSFTTREPECRYAAAMTRAVCTYPDLPVVPADEDTEADDRIFSMIAFRNRVLVARDAPAPAKLGGGLVSVLAVNAEETPAEEAPAEETPAADSSASAQSVGSADAPGSVADLPANATGGAASDLADEVEAGAAAQATPARGADVDPGDNHDEFVVYVAEPGGAGGGLPITGSRPGVTAAVGLTGVLTGAVLLLLTSRRRRTPAAVGIPTG